jgi:peptidoglycan hydrolase-like protein with peptidoglycan-binding domain
MHPLERAGALVVTAAAALVLGVASPALASTSGTEAQSTAAPADLIPEASWHGRPIKRPDPNPIQLRKPVSSTVIREGAGFLQAGGPSDAVRDVQRRLRALGYRPGPVDGAFGPRTRSSVAWFQIKHRLPPTGVVDGTTLDLLLFRTHGAPISAPVVAVATPLPDLAPGSPRPEAASAPQPQPEPVPRLARAPQAPAAVPRPDAAPVAPRPDPDPQESGLALTLQLLAILSALVVVAVFASWLRGGAPRPERAQLRRILPKRAQTKRVPARSPASRRGRPTPGAVAAHTNGNGRQVIGYAVGRDERDFVRQQRAIERVCGEHGWTLTALVKERESADRKRRRRPGLAHVLGQVAAGGVGRLIVGRLHSLASSPTELAALLEWCRRREVDLVALDVGLDTSTADGRIASRCLGAVSNGAARASGVR